MPDRFDSYAASLSGPAIHGFAITPDDSTGLPETTRAIYVGTAGDISVTLASGADVTFVNIPSGTLLPIRASHVKSTSTTAINVIGLV